MARLVLFSWTDVEYGHLTAPDTLDKDLTVHRLHAAVGLKVFSGHFLDLEQPHFSKPPEGLEESAHFLISQAVGYTDTVSISNNETCPPQDLQVVGCVCDRLAGLMRERVHGAGSLAQEVQQLETRATAERLSDAGQLLVDGVLVLPGVAGHSSLA